MPPFRDPYDHEQKLADLVEHYEHTKKRALRATASARKKLGILIVCAVGLAGWTGALMAWQRSLDQQRTDVASDAAVACAWQLNNCGQTAQNRLEAAQAAYIDLRDADAALVECEEERDRLERDLYRPDGSSAVFGLARAVVHEDRW